MFFFFRIVVKLFPLYPHLITQYFKCGNNKALLYDCFNSIGNKCFSLFNMPIIFEHLLDIYSELFFKLKSRVNHKQ